MKWGILMLMLLWNTPAWGAAVLPLPTCPTPPAGTTYRDYIDTQYGAAAGTVTRQIVRPAGNDHNLYHWRNPWNANNTYMLGYREMGTDPNDHSAATSYQALYDGNGCFLKLLYTINTYNYQGVWDKTDPDIFYTHKGSTLHRYHISTDQVDTLTTMEVVPATGATVTLNQAGTRLGIALSGTGAAAGRFRSWDLPGMTNQREFQPTHSSWTATEQADCDKRNWRYIGWGNVVITDCRNDPGNVYGSAFYQDTGTFVAYHAREIGHTDVGPAGKWAYFVEGVPSGTAVQVHLVDLTACVAGTCPDNVIHTFATGGDFSNMHLSWPRANPNFFFLGFFSNCSNPPNGTTQTDAPFDQLYKITPTSPTTSTVVAVAKTLTCEYASTWDHDNNTGTPQIPVVNAAGIESYFWTQPEPEVSADGSRVTWNMNCDQKPIDLAAPIPAGNCTAAFEGDQAILFLDQPGGVVVPPPDADFAARCSAAGVLKCHAFDNVTTDLVQGVNIFPDGGGTNRWALDTNIKASGAGSLRFDLPAAPHSGQNIAGSWTPPNATPAMGGTVFKENSTFWVQYRVRFSPSMITNTWQVATPPNDLLGWKVAIFHFQQTTCANIELTQREYASLDFPILYTQCGGANVFSNPFGIFTTSAPFHLQQGNFLTTCVYNTFTNCFKYTANEWITFTQKVTIGTWGVNNSRIEGWVNTESAPATRKVWDVSQYTLRCNNPGAGCLTSGIAEGFNNISLTPYMTGLDPNSGSAASVWYDELIVSTQQIAAPAFTVTPPSGLRLSGRVSKRGRIK